MDKRADSDALRACYCEPWLAFGMTDRIKTFYTFQKLIMASNAKNRPRTDINGVGAVMSVKINL